MSLNQYAVYQLKADPAIRPLRYKTYQYLMENHLRVDADRYHQVYLTTMIGEQSPEQIRKQLERKLPPKFMGSALNVSDVIAITKNGVSTAYYIDKDGFVVIPGFFRTNSSSALITMDTTGFVFEDRKGSWMATEDTVIDGKQFFLMGSETYGTKAAFAVVDDQGHKAAEDTVNGFDEETIKQIRQFLHLQKKTQQLPEQEKPPMEIWQKYYENGEYVRSAEAYGEQNYDMIDGRVNNSAKENYKTVLTASRESVVESKPAITHASDQDPKKRRSVLQRLNEKKAEVADRYGGKSPEMSKDDMERNRK